MLTLSAVRVSLSRASSGWSGVSSLTSLMVLPSLRISSVRFRRFARTFFDGRSIFDNTVSVIRPAKLSMRTIAMSARIAAMITRIAVVLISAKRKSTGNFLSRVKISFRSDSDKKASCCVQCAGRVPSTDWQSLCEASRRARRPTRPELPGRLVIARQFGNQLEFVQLRPQANYFVPVPAPVVSGLVPPFRRASRRS